MGIELNKSPPTNKLFEKKPITIRLAEPKRLIEMVETTIF
jgi:hypothetical protein